MEILRLKPNGHAAGLLLTFALLLHFGASAQNPTVEIIPLPGNLYSIGVTDLNTSDLVFYRFSDGYELTAMATSTNPKANVQRKFRMASATVSAFIARKNGPIDLAIGDINNPFCATCQPPAVGLAQGEYVRLRPTSWEAFVEPEHPTALNEIRTNPPYLTPEMPWYFMPVTIKGPSANARVFVEILEGMTVKGVVVKNNYKSVFVSGMTFNINDPDVKNFNYPAADRFFINLTAAFNNEFNVYLVITSSTDVGAMSEFEGIMFDVNGAQWGPTSQNLVVTHQNPHDPNVLTPLQTGTCYMQEDSDLLGYQVEFQNLGAGIADQVDVKIEVDRMILNPMAVQPHMITSSHQLSSFDKYQDSIVFHFQGIDLPGLDASPPPPVATTIGTVTVNIPTKTCIPESPPPHTFRSAGFVTFFNHHNHFEETIQTNDAFQDLLECGNSPSCNNLSGPLNDPLQATAQHAFDAKCFPSFVQNDLFVQCWAGIEEEPVRVMVSDIGGKIWYKYDYLAMPNALFQTSVDLGATPSGIYLIHVTQGNNSRVTKVIKQ